MTPLGEHFAFMALLILKRRAVTSAGDFVLFPYIDSGVDAENSFGNITTITSSCAPHQENHYLID
jgi:hypothetical protein